MATNRGNAIEPSNGGYNKPSGAASAFNLKALLPVVLSVAITMLVVMGWALPQYVSKVDDAKNINDMNGSIKSVSTAMGALQAKVESVTGTVANQVTQSVNQSLSGVNTQVASANQKITDMSSKVDAAKSAADSATAKLADVQKKTDDNTKALSDLQKKYDDLSKKVTTPTNGTSYQNPYSPNYGNSGSTSTWNGITATISNLYPSLTGMPLLSFPVQPASGGAITSLSLSNPGTGYTTNGTAVLMGGSGYGATATITVSNGAITNASINTQGQGYTQGNVLTVAGGMNGAVVVQQVTTLSNYSSSQSFVLNVINNNSQQAYNIQLALGLAVVDSSGNPLATMPSWLTPGTNVQVSTAGFGTSWTYSTTTAPSTMVFVSGTGTNTMFSFSMLDLAPGASTNLTEYITVTNSSPNSANTLYLYPVIRVIGAGFPGAPAH